MFLATGEPLDEDGMSSNPTKSLCNPFVFNTALSRAESLVVAVGNPFTLMRVEEAMGRPSSSHRGFQQRSWKEYIRVCLEEGTVCFSRAISKQEQFGVIAKLKKKVGLVASEDQHSRLARGRQSLPAADVFYPKIQAQSLFDPRLHVTAQPGIIGE